MRSRMTSAAIARTISEPISTCCFPNSPEFPSASIGRFVESPISEAGPAAIRARGPRPAPSPSSRGEKNAPLIFRLWRIGEPLALGFWNIPFPANSPELAPDVAIAPVVGFDQKGYRLGYGERSTIGLFAALTKKPRVFGIGYSQAAIATIYPLPHDIPMDVIVTEEGSSSAQRADVLPWL